MAYEAIKVSSGYAIQHTPGGAIQAGQVVLLDLVGAVANNEIAANELGSLDVGGVYDVAKASGTGVAFTVGQAVYWNNTTNKAVEDTGDILLGYAVKAAVSADTVVRTKFVEIPVALGS